MALQKVNVGTVANDGTGDPLRTAMQKINANYDVVFINQGSFVDLAAADAALLAAGGVPAGQTWASTTEDGLLLIALAGETAYTQKGGSSSVTWGDIAGTLGDQTDLQAVLDGKSSISHNHDGVYSPVGHNHASAYQPLDVDLTTVAGLGAALQVLRTNAGATAVEWATIAAGGNVVGGETDIVDNMIPRYNAATGLAIQGGQYSPLIDDNGTIHLRQNPSAPNGIIFDWPSGVSNILLQADDFNGGHGPFQILLQTVDFGQVGPNDFVYSIGIVGDGLGGPGTATKEYNTITRETGFDPGGGWRTHEMYDNIQHVDASHWPTVRRMGYTYSTFSNSTSGHAYSGTVSHGDINLEGVTFKSDYANPINPSIGIFGDYFSVSPNLVTGGTNARWAVAQALGSTYMDIGMTPTEAAWVTETLPIHITGNGGLLLQGTGSYLDMETVSGVIISESRIHARAFRTEVSATSTGFGTAVGIDLDNANPGTVGIASYFGSGLGPIVFQPNATNGWSFAVGVPEIKALASCVFGFVPGTDLLGASVDAAIGRAKAGMTKSCSDYTGGFGDHLARGYYLQQFTATPTTYPMNLEVARTIPAAADDYVEIGTFAGASGADSFRITISAADGGLWSVSKQYVFSGTYQGVAGGAATYKILRPLLSAIPGSSNDFDVDISDSGGASFVLRIRRTTGASGTCPCVVRIEGLSYSQYATFTASTATGTASPVPSAYYGAMGSDTTGKPIGFGTHSAIGSQTITGVIDVIDASGVARQVAVVS